MDKIKELTSSGVEQSSTNSINNDNDQEKDGGDNNDNDNDTDPIATYLEVSPNDISYSTKPSRQEYTIR